MRTSARNSGLRMEQRARATGLLDDAPPKEPSADPCEALPSSIKVAVEFAIAEGFTARTRLLADVRNNGPCQWMKHVGAGSKRSRRLFVSFATFSRPSEMPPVPSWVYYATLIRRKNPRLAR